MKRQTPLKCLSSLLALVAAVVASGAAMASGADEAAKKPAETRVPVILDTDIGDDIDDTWALAMLLRSPQLDLKLVTTTYGKSEYRAKIIAKLLSVAKRTDVPIGMGAGGRTGSGGQQRWVNDYDLAKYAGKVHEDGVKALIETIEASPEPIRVISIGPSDTVAGGSTEKARNRQESDLCRYAGECSQG